MLSDMSFEIKYHEHDTGNNAKININAQKKSLNYLMNI